MNHRLSGELGRDVRNGHYEETPEGILFTRSRLIVCGAFAHDVFRPGVGLLGERSDPNIVCNEGLDHTLDLLFAGATQINPWYVLIFEGNYTPVAGVTAATITADSTESTAYTESVRQTYVEAAASGQSITNSANKATFTINATKTMYGAALVSASAKSATTGTLFAASRFSASRDVINLDSLLITYTVTAADA